MLAKPFKPLVGAKLGSLFDSPTVGDHNRQRHATILSTPPTWHPVAAALLLCRTIRKEGDKRLAGQWHMGILQLGETKVPAFGNTAAGVRVDMAAQRRRWAAIRRLMVAIEILEQSVEACFAIAISFLLLGMHIVGKQIQRFDRCDAMALPHQPCTRTACQSVQSKVTGVGRHHVQRAAGMPFWRSLEVLGAEWRTVEPNATRIGHVHDQPESCRADSVDGLQ